MSCTKKMAFMPYQKNSINANYAKKEHGTESPNKWTKISSNEKKTWFKSYFRYGLMVIMLKL